MRSRLRIVVYCLYVDRRFPRRIYNNILRTSALLRHAPLRASFSLPRASFAIAATARIFFAARLRGLRACAVRSPYLRVHLRCAHLFTHAAALRTASYLAADVSIASHQ